jgi:hypothetical protein
MIADHDLVTIYIWFPIFWLLAYPIKVIADTRHTHLIAQLYIDHKTVYVITKWTIFFPESNIRLYNKNSESDYFFFLHQNQNIFFQQHA